MSQITQTLNVTGMSCNACARHVEQAIGELGGIEQTTVDLDREQVTVAYLPDVTSMADVEAAVRGAGYEVDGEAPKEPSRTSCCGCC